MTQCPAPGQDAIDAALAALYPGGQPRRVGFPSGGALACCVAYPAAGHWHYISYGLSELHEAGPEEDPEFSGWGFELTLRVRRGPEPEAPGWPFDIVHHLARQVNTRLLLLEPGHRLDLRRPVTGHPALPDAPPTGLTTFTLVVDPELGELATPNGKVLFLQAVGVTPAEQARMRAGGTAAVLAELAGDNPLLVTDPARAPWSPGVA
ncbi:suppressor of fused domain protein [Crossiella sp. NPDC003009]